MSLGKRLMPWIGAGVIGSSSILGSGCSTIRDNFSQGSEDYKEFLQEDMPNSKECLNKATYSAGRVVLAPYHALDEITSAFGLQLPVSDNPKDPNFKLRLNYSEEKNPFYSTVRKPLEPAFGLTYQFMLFPGKVMRLFKYSLATVSEALPEKAELYVKGLLDQSLTPRVGEDYYWNKELRDFDKEIEDFKNEIYENSLEFQSKVQLESLEHKLEKNPVAKSE